MARQHTTSQSFESSVGAALVGLGLVILFGKLDGPAAQLAKLTFSLLPRERRWSYCPFWSRRSGKPCTSIPSITSGFLRAWSRCCYHSGRCSTARLELYSYRTLPRIKSKLLDT
jgi:hypothetical protein